MAVSIDLSKTPSENFYVLLTKSTTALPENSAFTAEDITPSNVTAVTGRDDGNNTSVLLTPVPTSTLVYGPAKTVFYRRKDIASYNVVTEVTDDLENWAKETVAATVLAYLRANFSSVMTAAEFTVSDPVTQVDGTVTTTVKIVDDHLTLFGELDFVVTATETRMNTDQIPDTQDGFVDSGS